MGGVGGGGGQQPSFQFGPRGNSGSVHAPKHASMWAGLGWVGLVWSGLGEAPLPKAHPLAANVGLETLG